MYSHRRGRRLCRFHRWASGRTEEGSDRWEVGGESYTHVARNRRLTEFVCLVDRPNGPVCLCAAHLCTRVASRLGMFASRCDAGSAACRVEMMNEWCIEGRGGWWMEHRAQPTGDEARSFSAGENARGGEGQLLLNLGLLFPLPLSTSAFRFPLSASASAGPRTSSSESSIVLRFPTTVPTLTRLRAISKQNQ